MVEMYCDLLLARFGLLETMKVVDEGIAEAVSSLIWVAPRMQTDATELKIVSDHTILLSHIMILYTNWTCASRNVC